MASTVGYVPAQFIKALQPGPAQSPANTMASVGGFGNGGGAMGLQTTRFPGAMGTQGLDVPTAFFQNDAARNALASTISSYAMAPSPQVVPNYTGRQQQAPVPTSVGGVYGTTSPFAAAAMQALQQSGGTLSDMFNGKVGVGSGLQSFAGNTGDNLILNALSKKFNVPIAQLAPLLNGVVQGVAPGSAAAGFTNAVANPFSSALNAFAGSGSSAASGAGKLLADGTYDFSGVAAPEMGATEGGLGSFGTALGALGGAYGAYNAIDNWQSGDYVGNTERFAGAGAAIGSVVPGIGTLIGGAIGAGVGALSSAFGGGKQSDADRYWDMFKKNPNINPSSIPDKDFQHIWGGGYDANNGFLGDLNSALKKQYGPTNKDGQMWNYQQFIKDSLISAAKSGTDLRNMNGQQLMDSIINPATSKLLGGKANPILKTNFAPVVQAFATKLVSDIDKPGSGIYSELYSGLHS